MPTDCAAAWSSATARKARPVFGPLKEQRQTGDQNGRDRPAPDVELVDQDAAIESLVEQEPGVGRKQPQRIDVGAEHESARRPSIMKVMPMVDMNSVRPS
jgi:hypothetical protein